MKALFIGKNCIEVEKTDSTNSYLAILATGGPISFHLLPLSGGEGKGVFDGTVVITKRQEQGKGQRDNRWESEPGKNLTLSILLKPTFLRTDEQFQLNKAVSLGVAEFVLAVFFPFEGGKGDVRIKWPNDIYIGNKKIAGILIENSVSGNTLQQSIVGIGINVNQEKFSAELPNPTSLKLVSGKEFDLKECLEELCSCIEKRYLQLRPPSGILPKEEGGIDSDYLKSLYRFGEPANYKYKGQALNAKITGVTKVGKLMIETEKGKMLECDFKEVMFC